MQSTINNDSLQYSLKRRKDSGRPKSITHQESTRTNGRTVRSWNRSVLVETVSFWRRKNHLGISWVHTPWCGLLYTGGHSSRRKPLQARTLFSWGTRWPSWLRHCATSRKVAGSIPDGVIAIFHWPFWPHCDPGVDSASNRNEYQEYFLGGKGGRCVGPTNLPPSCADCLEIWEPQPPGTLRAYPGL